MAYTVYVLRDKEGKTYVGTTSLPLKQRWNNGNGYRFCTDLWETIQRDGWGSIVKEIVAENLCEEDASRIERETIARFDSTNPDCGYNREMGGVKKLKVISDESRARMSIAHTGERNHNYGKHFSEEHRMKLSVSNTGKKRSEETCIKIGQSKNRPIIQYSLNNEKIAVYASGKEAAMATGVQAGHISKVCKHKRMSAGGFKWAYA